MSEQRNAGDAWQQVLDGHPELDHFDESDAFERLGFTVDRIQRAVERRHRTLDWLEELRGDPPLLES